MVNASPSLKRLYEPEAYDTAIAPDSHWRATAPDVPPRPGLDGDQRAEFAIIGAGYAGLNAALRLAGRHHGDVAVLDAGQPGWGASGRNAGFCCMGGAKLSARTIARRYGVDEARDFDRFQVDAVSYVREALEVLGIDAERGPAGELCLAHSRSALAALRSESAFESGLFGRRVEILQPEELAEMGLATHWAAGGVLNPVGFPLHPLKYHQGLTAAASAAGVRLLADSPVTSLTRDGPGWRLDTERGCLHARRVLIATNGYSSDNLPGWLAGRTLPVLSSVLVTRPLSDAERNQQGWTAQTMTYDSRQLLHYYRLLPDRRFLFGMRGAIRASRGSIDAMHQKARRHLSAMFPRWSKVPVERHWSGLLCLTGSLTPFAGPVPDHEGLYAAFGWHGNGVSAASYAGACVADQMAGATSRLPGLMGRPPDRFPLPRYRRAALRAAYAWLEIADGRIPPPQGKARGAS